MQSFGETRYLLIGNGMVFEMSIQDFNDQTQDHMYPHHNGVVDYREGSFISEEVKGYQEPGVYHSDSQVGTVFIRISVPELKLQVWTISYKLFLSKLFFYTSEPQFMFLLLRIVLINSLM